MHMLIPQLCTVTCKEHSTCNCKKKEGRKENLRAALEVIL
uniref:Uncharacterized protein n=1 Tax=Rhizophora mucronata TaxID=61149 RepID=A0A2P2PFT6_RHIMU